MARSSNINVTIRRNNFKEYSGKARKAYGDALDDCINDLVRTSSQSAPHDEGILEKSWSKNVNKTGDSPKGKVTYSVKKQSGKGNFNYALFMHESDYKLGAGSQAKTGGTGMSGKTYPVGKDYLGGVLKGEKETYINHIADSLKGVL